MTERPAKTGPFEAGDFVAVEDSSWGWPNTYRDRISKVYKTGNFILKKSEQQYKQSGHSTGAWSHRTCEHWSNEKHAPLAQRSRMRHGVKNLAYDLEESIERISIEDYFEIVRIVKYYKRGEVT